MKSDVVCDAMVFALDRHKNQKRKYTFNRYADHLAEVAGLVAGVIPYNWIGALMIAIAWLHDVKEDQGVTDSELIENFGWDVAAGVQWLTDLPVTAGKRAFRFAEKIRRLAMAPGWIQTIKCADIYCNLKSIMQHDRKFAPTYVQEVKQLVDVMTRAHPKLRTLVLDEINQAMRELRLI